MIDDYFAVTWDSGSTQHCFIVLLLIITVVVSFKPCNICSGLCSDSSDLLPGFSLWDILSTFRSNLTCGLGLAIRGFLTFWLSVIVTATAALFLLVIVRVFWVIVAAVATDLALLVMCDLLPHRVYPQEVLLVLHLRCHCHKSCVLTSLSVLIDHSLAFSRPLRNIFNWR